MTKPIQTIETLLQTLQSIGRAIIRVGMKVRQLSWKKFKKRLIHAGKSLREFNTAKAFNLFMLAWRNLWAHPMRSLLSIGGVTLGIGAIIFLVSLGFGLERLVTSQIANTEAFTILDVNSTSLSTGKIDNTIGDKVRAIPHVVNAAGVADLAGRVRLGNQNSTTESIFIAGKPDYFTLAELPDEKVVAPNGNTVNKAVINTSLAGLLGYSTNADKLIGQSLVADIIIPQALRRDDGVAGPVTKEAIQLTIAGVTNDTQNPIVYVTYDLLGNAGLTNRTSLKVKIDSRLNVGSVRDAIDNMGLSTDYVGDTVDQISQVFGLFRLILGGLGLIVLVVAGLGTFNTLTIALLERIREIGLLKSLGMKNRDIFTLYITESIIIGVIGGILGIVLGSLIGIGLNALVQSVAVHSGAQPVSIYESIPSFMLSVGFGSFILGIFTGLYPAVRAIKTNPLDILRYQ